MTDENTRWLLSFYRGSEIAGSLFFGRLARTLSESPIQHDLSQHFADEAQHAWYWTRCLQELGARPLAIEAAYQDRYLAAAGVPANLMEVLALTQVFECRVIRQYALHSKVPALAAPIRATLELIMRDEKRHIRWIRRALAAMAREYGAGELERALERFTAADAAVYAATFAEHAARVQHIFDHSRG